MHRKHLLSIFSNYFVVLLNLHLMLRFLLAFICCVVRFSDLTGTDYSEGAIDLARRLADRDSFTNIKFLVKLNFVSKCKLFLKCT